MNITVGTVKESQLEATGAERVGRVTVSISHRNHERPEFFPGIVLFRSRRIHDENSLSGPVEVILVDIH
jgi:hypothetical protein